MSKYNCDRNRTTVAVVVDDDDGNRSTAPPRNDFLFSFIQLTVCLVALSSVPIDLLVSNSSGARSYWERVIEDGVGGRFAGAGGGCEFRHYLGPSNTHR